MKIAIIGSHDATRGFQLMGVHHALSVDISSRSSCETALAQVIDLQATGKHDDPENGIGLLLIEEAVADTIRGHLDEWKEEKGVFPVVMEIPGPAGPRDPKNDPVKGLIRLAVGIDISDE